jgi:hypothetical protein
MPQSILTSILTTFFTVSLFVFLGKTWITARLKASIEQEYKKQFEFFKRELDQKQKVELVADLLASNRGQTTIFSKYIWNNHQR